MMHLKLNGAILSACIVLMIYSCGKKTETREDQPATTDGTALAVKDSVDKQPDTAPDSLTPKAFVEKQFAEMVTDRTAELRKMIDGVKGQYHGFLVNRESRKTEFLGNNIDTSKMIERYTAESDPDAKWYLLDTIRTVQSLKEYADAVTYEVKDSVLVAGLLIGKDHNGAEVLREVLPARGTILLVTPQLLYAWPGENCSAREVLSPVNAPCSVLAVWSSRNPSSDAADLIDKYGKVNVDSLKNYSANGYLLIKNNKGSAGWINRDSCAYFRPTEAVTREMEGIYKGGFAWAFNGIWQCPEAYYGSEESDRGYGKREVYDFRNKIIIQTNGNVFADSTPYPVEVEGYQLNLYYYSIGETKIRQIPLLYLCLGGDTKKYYCLINKSIVRDIDDMTRCPKICNSIDGW